MFLVLFRLRFRRIRARSAGSGIGARWGGGGVEVFGEGALDDVGIRGLNPPWDGFVAWGGWICVVTQGCSGPQWVPNASAPGRLHPLSVPQASGHR